MRTFLLIPIVLFGQMAIAQTVSSNAGLITNRQDVVVAGSNGHHLTLRKDVKGKLIVTNMAGQVVMVRKVKRRIDVSSLPGGSYHLALQTETGVHALLTFEKSAGSGMLLTER